MKDIIAKKVKDMQPSGIRLFFDLVLGMDDVISLGVGEPDFVTPWQIREAGITSLEEGYTSYTSNKGLYKLRMAISRYLKSNYGVEYSPDDEILITVGVSEAVDLALRALLNPGDKVIVPQPSYVSYGPVTELAGGTAVYIDTSRSGFKLAPADLDRHIDSRVKALILNYPSNPTGVTYTRKELEALKKIVLKHNILCITDEVYGDLTFDFEHVPFPSLSGTKEHTLYLNGFSKNYAMTGWRVGFACGPKEIIAAMTKIHQYTIMCVSITGQMAAAEALHIGRKPVDEMKREYRRRRELICDGLSELGFTFFKPQGAFYIYPSIKSTGMHCLDFARGLLEQQKVAVIPGTAFGERFTDRLRMCYALSYEDLKEALRRMKLYLENKR